MIARDEGGLGLDLGTGMTGVMMAEIATPLGVVAVVAAVAAAEEEDPGLGHRQGDGGHARTLVRRRHHRVVAAAAAAAAAVVVEEEAATASGDGGHGHGRGRGRPLVRGGLVPQEETGTEIFLEPCHVVEEDRRGKVKKKCVSKERVRQ